MLVLYGRLTFQPACVFRGLNKGINCVNRRAAGVGEESAQGARSCDLEGNRAGLGCLEHLRNALSFAVVTEWPVGVYPMGSLTRGGGSISA